MRDDLDDDDDDDDGRPTSRPSPPRQRRAPRWVRDHSRADRRRMRAGVRPRVNCGAVRGGANDRWYPNLLDRAMTSMLKRHYKAGAVESLAAEPRSLPALMRKSAPRWVAAAVPSIYGSIKVDNLEPS